MVNEGVTLDSILRGLRHSVRDLTLVVLGVLMALAANSWWEGRQEARVELVVLDAMMASLTTELASLNLSIANLHDSESVIVFLRGQLAGSAQYSADLDAVFGRAYQVAGVTLPNPAPYEALKSRGLQIVREDSLRQQIIDVYENVYARVRLANDINYNVMFDALRPYFLSHFRDLRFGQRATPLDYAALARDPYFDNLLAYRGDIIRGSLLVPYETAAEEVSRLLDAVEKRIETDGSRGAF